MNNSSDPFFPGVLPAGWHRLASLVLLMLLSASAAVISARAFAGALERPLDSAALLSAGLLVTVATAVIRLGWLLPTGDSRLGRLDLATMALTTIAAAALCCGLCLPPNTTPEGVIIIRVFFVAEEGWAWLWIVKRGQNYYTTTKSPCTPRMEKNNSSDPLYAAEVLQQMTRIKEADGTEKLTGWLRLTLAAGQRTGSLHVAFCPPMPAAPELSVEQIDGPEARVKTAQLLPYGVRLDLKLVAAAEEPSSVLLRFSARASQ